MKIYAPVYCRDFKCISNKCRHNCCRDWEIDIDSETAEKYNRLSGELGEKIKSKMVSDSDGCHFKLNRAKKCPFLNKNNLCEIIRKLGEDYLCDICKDHPRYKNFYSGRVEIGIGLCCEEAARLIVTGSRPYILEEIGDDGLEARYDAEEEKIFKLRRKLIKIIGDRSISIGQRLDKIRNKFFVSAMELSKNEMVKIYSQLEVLDKKWLKMINELSEAELDFSIFSSGKWDICFERLLVYFITRHLIDGVYDDSVYARLRFSVISVYLIRAMWCMESMKRGEVILDDLLEIARMYSAEIEYSSENIEMMLTAIK